MRSYQKTRELGEITELNACTGTCTKLQLQSLKFDPLEGQGGARRHLPRPRGGFRLEERESALRNAPYPRYEHPPCHFSEFDLSEYW